MRRAVPQGPRAQLLQLLTVVGDAPAQAAEGEAGPQDEREPKLQTDAHHVVQRMPDAGPRHVDADGGHAVLEALGSSAFSIASSCAPMSWQPYLARIPCFASCTARFSAVWPPMVGRTASGRSTAMIRSAASTVMGSM